MAIKDYGVQPLFAEPLFRADIGHAITPDQVEFIKNLKMINNKTNFISENLYIFEEKALKGIAKGVQDALDLYAKEVMGISQKLYVTQSWSLINPPNVGMHGHSHSNSIVSGSLYFTEMAEPVAGMVFDKHRTYRQLELNPERERHNLFNTPVNVVKPKVNDVVLFSSGLQHYVETNTTNQPRYSIAFNTFIKGKIGNFRDVSELTLA